MVQTATSLLDLVGIGLLGLVGLLAVSSVADQPPPEWLVRVLASAGLDASKPALIAALAGTAAALLIAKNLANPLLMARVQRFLARREALVSARLTKELLSRPLSFVHRRSSQQTALALLDGTYWAVQVVLGQATVAISEAALLVLLIAVVFIVNPVVAIGFTVFFALVATVLFWARSHESARLATERRRANVASLTAVQEAIGTYREITVSNRRVFYVNRIEGLRVHAADANAGLQIAGMLPKYVSEGALVFGAFGVGAFLFATQSVALAMGTFTLVLATATRVMPSLLRFQAATLAIAAAGASAVPTFELADDLHETPAAGVLQQAQPSDAQFVPSIEVRDVTFTYPGTTEPAVTQISLTVAAGTAVALVGRSGAGKSTLADLILGVLLPDTGAVALSGRHPAEAVQRWPGSIAYVPQDVALTNSSVRANVALGFPLESIDDDLVWDALRRAHLADFIREQPAGLNSEIGEHGLRLSGGQRQRLGIARALFTRPRLLVLDEATSALDAETEDAVTKLLDELAGKVTTVIIAHRLSTIRHADLVVYLEDGKLLAHGSFGEVCKRVPGLQRQAALMGMGHLLPHGINDENGS